MTVHTLASAQQVNLKYVASVQTTMTALRAPFVTRKKTDAITLLVNTPIVTLIRLAKWMSMAQKAVFTRNAQELLIALSPISALTTFLKCAQSVQQMPIAVKVRAATQGLVNANQMLVLNHAILLMILALLMCQLILKFVLQNPAQKMLNATQTIVLMPLAVFVSQMLTVMVIEHAM
jgi:hypothetical protein